MLKLPIIITSRLFKIFQCSNEIREDNGIITEGEKYKVNLYDTSELLFARVKWRFNETEKMGSLKFMNS